MPMMAATGILEGPAGDSGGPAAPVGEGLPGKELPVEGATVGKGMVESVPEAMLDDARYETILVNGTLARKELHDSAAYNDKPRPLSNSQEIKTIGLCRHG